LLGDDVEYLSNRRLLGRLQVACLNRMQFSEGWYHLHSLSFLELFFTLTTAEGRLPILWLWHWGWRSQGILFLLLSSSSELCKIPVSLLLISSVL
jgi:hypothetical protein